jgi:hypothetical protein
MGRTLGNGTFDPAFLAYDRMSPHTSELGEFGEATEYANKHYMSPDTIFPLLVSSRRSLSGLGLHCMNAKHSPGWATSSTREQTGLAVPVGAQLSGLM